MSLVATRLSLKHRCSILRDAASTDEWGNAEPPDWQTVYSGVHCRAWNDAGREAVTNERTVVVLDLRMIVPLGTDVGEADRIGDIIERETVIFAGPFAVEAVLRRPDHLELLLEKYR